MARTHALIITETAQMMLNDVFSCPVAWKVINPGLVRHVFKNRVEVDLYELMLV